MNVLDFNDRGRAYVSEQEFMEYLAKTALRGDYTKSLRAECEVNDKDYRVCDFIGYYNEGGCLLARYNRDFNYGELI